MRLAVTAKLHGSLPRTLLVLGRVSNLPTVWSNCLAALMLAGWLPDGAQSVLTLTLLIAGCTLLYLGGMYLNDAFDVRFDTLYRPERPIPGGRISRGAVTLLGSLFMIAGLALMLPRGGLWAVALAGTILLYDAIHKHTPLAPLPMAACRVLIYPVAGAMAGAHHFPAVLWVAALAMGVWVLVLSVLARAESGPVFAPRSVIFLLALPLIAAFSYHGLGATIPAALLALWIARCGAALYSQQRPSRAVVDLLAGIPLVDLLAVSPPHGVGYLPYLGLFFTALLLRRSIPPS